MTHPDYYDYDSCGYGYDWYFLDSGGYSRLNFTLTIPDEKLPPTRTISGTVMEMVNIDTAPGESEMNFLIGMNVCAHNLESGNQTCSTTNKGGTYTLNVPPGVYRVTTGAK